MGAEFFHVNGQSGRQTNGRTNGHDEANSRFSQFCERALKHTDKENDVKKQSATSIEKYFKQFFNSKFTKCQPFLKVVRGNLLTSALMWYKLHYMAQLVNVHPISGFLFKLNISYFTLHSRNYDSIHHTTNKHTRRDIGWVCAHIHTIKIAWSVKKSGVFVQFASGYG